ncbi:MAG: HEAT repeat domain-containing protein [Nitrospinales bacterium]
MRFFGAGKFLVYLFSGVLTGIFLLAGFSDSRGQPVPELVIRYEQSRLSADVRRVPVSEVVRELQRKTGIEFSRVFLPDIQIFGKFDNLSLEDGIRKLLPLNTIFVYGDTPGKIDSVIILSSFEGLPGASRPASPAVPESKKPPRIPSVGLPFVGRGTPQQSEATRNEVRLKRLDSKLRQIQDGMDAYPWIRQLKDPDPEKRLQAAVQLGELGTEAAKSALFLALDDEEKEVRDAVVQQLKEVDERNIFRSFRKALQTPDEAAQNDALELIRVQSGPKWVALLEEGIEPGLFADSLKDKAKAILKSLRQKGP